MNSAFNLKVKIIHRKNVKMSLTDEENLQFNLDMNKKYKDTCSHNKPIMEFYTI